MKKMLKYLLVFVAGVIVAVAFLYNAFINAEVGLMDNVENGNKIVVIKFLNNFYAFETQDK